MSRVSLGLWSRRSEYGRRSLARGLESRGAIVLVLVLVEEVVVRECG